MEFAVYSFGGAEILWKCLNGVAIVFQTAYFESMGALMVGIALLVTAARAIPIGSFPILFRGWIMPTFFLTAFFWGPKVSVHIIDRVDPDFKYSKVDHVPLGLAMAASFSSQVSDLLTELVERAITSSDQERFSRAGPMFAARLVHEARTLTIKDPLIRENLKDFARQCFAWPYVFSNLAPGKKAALETEDMLSFIEADPHLGLGIYWRKGFGDSEFMNCRQCAAKVREVIPLEVERGFESLANSLFGLQRNGAAQTHRLKQYFGEAWQFLAKGSSNAAQVIQQELMLNSYRSALQDKREELGLGRTSALTYYLNAERGQAHQDASFLVKSALAGAQLPTLHTVMLAIALVFFTIVAPFTFVSGGLSLVTSWAKVMAWLATWPPLFAILNALGYMFAAKATAFQTMGYGEGLNLMTQNGLSDAAYHAYCFVMGLQYSVPFVSWALISSGGGYALSQFSSFLTQTGESFASKAASEMVDGNVSFDSQTLHCKSVANAQMSQQQLGSFFSYGSKVDDGKLLTLYGTQGQQTFQEHQTQMATNVSGNDALSSLLSLQSTKSFNASLAQSKSAGEQVQLGSSELFSVMKKLSNAKGFTEIFGESGNASVQKSFQETVDQIEKYATAHNISNEKALSAMLNASVEGGANFRNKSGKIAPGGKGAGGMLGGVTGGVKANVNAQYKLSVRDAESISKDLNASDSDRFAQNISHALNYLNDKKGSIGDSLTADKVDQMQWHYNKAQVYGEQSVASFQEAEAYNESASLQRQQGVNSSSNLNEDALREVANKRFGGDMSQAAQEASRNPEAYRQEVSRQIANRQSGMRPQGLTSEAAVRQTYESGKLAVNDIPLSNPVLEAQRRQRNFANDTARLEKKVETSQDQAKMAVNILKESAGSSQPLLEAQYKKQEEEFQQESEKWAIRRIVERIFK